jgi:hypothetical protein
VRAYFARRIKSERLCALPTLKTGDAYAWTVFIGPDKIVKRSADGPETDRVTLTGQIHGGCSGLCSGLLYELRYQSAINPLYVRDIIAANAHISRICALIQVRSKRSTLTGFQVPILRFGGTVQLIPLPIGDLEGLQFDLLGLLRALLHGSHGSCVRVFPPLTRHLHLRGLKFLLYIARGSVSREPAAFRHGCGRDVDGRILFLALDRLDVGLVFVVAAVR